MKVLIDVNKIYYEMLKHDVEVNHNDYIPCVLIARGTPVPDNWDEKIYDAGYHDGYEDAKQLYN